MSSLKLTKACKSPDGTRYWRLGQGLPVILIHGVGLDSTMWNAQVDALAKRYDVIAYDMLGHGESALPAEDAVLDDFADQLAALLDHLGLTRAAVVGFSMGGLVARAFALRHPTRLTGMVVLSSVFERDTGQRASILQRLAQVRNQGPSANVDTALERWFSPAFRAAHPETISTIHAIICDNHPQGYYRSYSLFGTQDCFGADRLATIRMPVLIVTGELDPGSTPRMAEALAERLPYAEVHIIPGQRHMVPIEDPDSVNALVMRFLADIPTRYSLEEIT